MASVVLTGDTSGQVTLSAPAVAGSNTATLPASTGNILLDSTAGVCKAWVNFDGTASPGTIKAAFNVSSVTNNSTGDYTVNFTNALSDANYAAVINAGNLADTTATVMNGPYTTQSTTAYRFRTKSIGGAGSNSLQAFSYVSCVIFR